MRPPHVVKCSHNDHIVQGALMVRKIGVREAKARLSQLLRDVERGREWTITARGRPVARLIPAARKETVEEWVRRLEREGRLIPPPPGARWPKPIPISRKAAKLAQKWLREDRDTTW